MRYTVNKSLLAIAVSGILIAPAANATNGYFMHGVSTKEKGLAGAGTAFSQDAMAAATNPAGMAFVGERFDIGAAIFSPSNRGYKVTGAPPVPGGVGVTALDPAAFPALACNPIFTQPSGACAPPFSVDPGKHDSKNDFFLIPHGGYNWQLDSDTAVGVSFYGNGGMNTEYTKGSATLPNGSKPNQGLPIESLKGTYGDGNAGVDLVQGFLNISFAKKLNDKHAFGASVLIAGQRFAAKGLGNFGQFSLTPNKLDSAQHSYSFGVGLKVGYQGEVADGVRVGVSYQSKINMQEYDEYRGLFAEKGDFDIPSTYNFGVAIDIGETGVLVADVQRIIYSDVDAISNKITPLMDGTCANALNATLQAQAPTAAAGVGCLGGQKGAGFGWKDMTIIKLGYQFDMSNSTFRFGYSHAEQPIGKKQTLFNILAPAVIEDHITAGWTYRLAGNQEINLAGMYAPKNKVKGANPFDGGATDIEIYMSQWEFQGGWAIKY
jgi:long-chain fatty acid transport protein